MPTVLLFCNLANKAAPHVQWDMLVAMSLPAVTAQGAARPSILMPKANNGNLQLAVHAGLADWRWQCAESRHLDYAATKATLYPAPHDEIHR